MKKYNFIFMVLISLMFLNTIKVEASTCSDVEMEFYVDLASKIELNPSVNFVGESLLVFEVNISNGNDFLVVESDLTKKSYLFYDDVITDKVSNDNQGYTYNIYTSSDTNCSGELLATRYMNFPNYNYASNREICEGNEKYEVCGSWYPYDLTDSEITTIINRYIAEEDEENEASVETVITSMIEKIMTFIKDNMIILIIVIVILIVSSIILFYKKRKEAIIK